MFNWFKPKENTQSIEIKQNAFSTDMDFSVPRTKLIRDALAKTFQKTATDFPIIAPSMAMDSTDDSFDNLKAAMNTTQGLNDAMLSWYGSQGFIGYQACAMIAQQWLVDKACTMTARDAVRKGYDLTVNDGTEVKPEILEEIAKLDKKYKLDYNLEQFERMCRIFGIRIAMFKVDGIDYEKPFNIDGVKKGSYKGISQIDPYWMTPELKQEDVSDPSSINFYEPEFWRVSGQRIHRSHLCLIRNSEVTDILKPSYLYGGIPIPQKIAERVYAAERTANEAPMLAMTKRLNVRKVDLEKVMANQYDFEEKIKYQDYLRNNFGTLFAGLDESVEQLETALADLDVTIMTQYQLVAAASGVPATKLLGTSPKGFNATGEFEESSYHEELESIQTHHLDPMLNRHHELLIRSEICPMFGIKPFSVEACWKPVDSPTAAELAEINSKKAATDNTLMQAGAIDGVDIRQRLIADRDSGYNGISDTVPEMTDNEAENDG